MVLLGHERVDQRLRVARHLVQAIPDDLSQCYRPGETDLQRGEYPEPTGEQAAHCRIDLRGINGLRNQADFSHEQFLRPDLVDVRDAVVVRVHAIVLLGCNEGFDTLRVKVLQGLDRLGAATKHPSLGSSDSCGEDAAEEADHATDTGVQDVLRHLLNDFVKHIRYLEDVWQRSHEAHNQGRQDGRGLFQVWRDLLRCLLGRRHDEFRQPLLLSLEVDLLIHWLEQHLERKLAARCALELFTHLDRRLRLQTLQENGRFANGPVSQLALVENLELELIAEGRYFETELVVLGPNWVQVVVNCRRLLRDSPEANLDVRVGYVTQDACVHIWQRMPREDFDCEVRDDWLLGWCCLAAFLRHGLKRR
mmetsp:Transcript_53999/g.150178  ORF Transcript_53999/g.150178 Transcript_53999/m.150178 type:complete len:364 (+) Transcript_53999:445-1536(+)